MNDATLPHGMPRGASVSKLAEQGTVKKPPGKGSASRQSTVLRGLQLGFPVDSSSEAGYGDPVAETQMIITIDDLHPYERNPRRSNPNPEYASIKESIRNAGLHHPLTITKRPGEDFYIVESGGNTRLQILRELWEETKDEKFYRLSVVFKPWSKESTVLAKHLIENNVRGEMTFWDNATGFMELKALLEDEAGQSGVSLRRFEEMLRSEGVSCNKTDLAKFGFAVNYLKPLGAALPYLPSRAVAEIQPRFNQLKQFAEKHVNLSEDMLYEEILNPAMMAFGERFSALVGDERKVAFDTDALLRGCEEALSSHLGIELKGLQIALAGGQVDPGVPPVTSGSNPAVSAPASDRKRVQKYPENEDKASGSPEAVHKSSSSANGLPIESFAAAQTDHDVSREIAAGEENPDPLQTILQEARHFAGFVDVLDVLRVDEALPFGFWVEVKALDPDADSLKHIGWWVLCSLSGQLHGEFLATMPSESAWRQAMDGDHDAATATLGGLPDFLNFHHVWALDADGFSQELFDSYIRLLKAMRSFKAAEPSRFGGMGGMQ